MLKNILLKSNSHLLCKWLFLFCVISISSLISNCSQQQEPEQILATVNDTDITVFDFEQRYVEHLIQTGRNDTKTERYQFLNKLLDKLVLADEAAQKNYLSHQIYKDAIWYQQRKSLADVYFVDQMNEIIEDPTEEEVRLAFAKSKRKVYVRHLFSKDENALYAFYDQLEQGEDFVDVANDFYGTSEYDSTAGYLGPVTYYGIDDNFSETAFSLNEGEFSKPIKTSFGFHIIYVEKVLFEALLTESEFQIRRPGMVNKVKQRNQKLQANKYISELMSKLNVDMNREILLSVMEEIQSLPSVQKIEREKAQGSNEVETWNDGKLDELALEVDNQAVLGTYVLLGERFEFTVQDYLDWLPYLSLNESKNRTGASVGRALRNEVLMQLAKSKGYEDDPHVQKKIKQRGQEVLSELYQQDLIQEALQDTSEITVPKKFQNQVVRNRTYELKASYWKISATSPEEARLIRNEIVSGKTPQSYPTYVSFKDIDLTLAQADYSLVGQATPGTPVAMNAGPQGWVVMNVTNKDFTEVTTENSNTDVKKMYRVLTYLDSKIDSMRSSAQVSVDTTLFNEIYEL